MSLTGLRARAQTVAALRQTLLVRGYEEIIPQYMEKMQPLEPAIYPFKVADQYLATSPESYLKKAMAAGVGKCFAVSHAFRNLEGEGPLHRPEFLMAEWYLPDTDWQEMMQETQVVVTKVLAAPPASWQRVSWLDLWQQYVGADLLSLITAHRLHTFAENKGYNIEGASWEQLFHQIALNEIEPHFPAEPFFLVDFPARISPLAKPQSEKPLLAERFELIINRIEIANGNTENVDAEMLRAMMKAERKNHLVGQPVDEDFLTAVAKLSGRQWAGVGLGIDRLAMIIRSIPTVKELQVA